MFAANSAITEFMNNIDMQAIIDTLEEITDARACELDENFVDATDEEIRAVALALVKQHGIKMLVATNLVATAEKARMDEMMDFDDEDEDF